MSALGPAAVDPAIHLLGDADPARRGWAAMLLGELNGPAAVEARRAVPALTKALADEFGPTRSFAARALYFIDPAAGRRQAVPVLLRDLQDERPDTRFYACLAASDIGPVTPEMRAAIERERHGVFSWRDYLRDRDDPELAAALRLRERTGRPLGDEPFLRKIGKLLGRDLVPKKPGPAPKKRKKKRR